MTIAQKIKDLSQSTNFFSFHFSQSQALIVVKLMSDRMQWTNALSTSPSLETAITEVVERIKPSLSGNPDFGILFISSAYATDFPRVIPLLLEKLSIPVLIGCGGGGIIGMSQDDSAVEIEANPAISLSVAQLPGVEIHPFHLSAEALPDLDSPPQTWVELVGVSPQDQPKFILLCDPFTSKVNDLLEGLDFAYPGSTKVGGLASAGMMGVPSALFYHARDRSGQSLYREGTVGVALSGNLVLETIVAQGCRPIGKLYQVSGGERNVILKLSEVENGDESIETSKARPPLEVLRDVLETLNDKDKELAQHSLFIGIARDEFKFQLGQGDFLIRNLLGVDPRQGAMAVGDRIRPGQRVQFHLRDSNTSAEDLELLLESYQQQQNSVSHAAGALMFSCLGRGETLYGLPNFDSGLFQRYLNQIPLGGFFCNGEIGPVGDRTFLHGYTSAFAIFRQP
ncbi:MAG: FIST C-terminal domain-containing protein [Hydrococcus sp. Prado102]|nr:FIST C-terminal domain-containing protein [Hydrococcus sp. Prado102]